jgi:hypothetical protein
MKPRSTWKEIDHGKRWSSEVALSTAEELEVMRRKRAIPWLNQKKKEMQLDLIVGTSRKLGYSRWHLEDGWLRLDEHKFDKGQYLSEDNLKILIKDRMLCVKQSQYYVRKGSLGHDLENAMKDVKRQLTLLLKDNQMRVGPD